MEQNSKAVSNYLRELERCLDCPKVLRRPFLNRTRQMAEDLLQEKPAAAIQDIADYLGSPQELARGFMETLDPQMLGRYHKKKKAVRCGVVAALSILLVIVTAFAIRLQLQPANVEVISVIYIYD